MSIRLGNMSIKDMENRVGVSFPKELVSFMNDRHQPEADTVQKGKWHCFDIPFSLVCGDMETAQKVYDHLKPIAGQFEKQLDISITK